MNARRLRPWLPFIALALAVVVLAAVRLLRPSTAGKSHGPPPPVHMTPSSWSDASYIRSYLEAIHVKASVTACPDRPDACYASAPGADPSVVLGLPATPDYADCWRGVLLVEAAAGDGDGPYEMQAGPYHFFGDVGMVRQVRQALEHPTGP